MHQRHVVITGLGVLAPNGCGKEAFWQACLQGRTIPSVQFEYLCPAVPPWGKSDPAVVVLVDLDAPNSVQKYWIWLEILARAPGQKP
jgi:hypothetical protein